MHDVAYSGPHIELPENPDFTIFTSATESARFTLEKCLTTYNGHTCATSSFVTPDGETQLWHDFGPLE